MKLNYQMIGNKIRYHRLRADMTQEDLADAANISRTHMGYLERGDRTPGLETLICIANVLHITLEDLLEGQMTIADATHSDIFRDCSKVEIEILLSVITEMKNVLHKFSITE